jgi:hypothetical protein
MTMPDVREQILSRLLEICDGVDGVNYAARNDWTLDDDSIRFPALIVLDGDEEAIEDNPTARPATVARRIAMSPLFGIVTGEKPEDLGTELNTIRSALIKAIVEDSQLAALVDRNGISYNGMDSPRDDGGRLMLGRRFLRFTFIYLLIPSRL